jgi:hypothetical protein
MTTDDERGAACVPWEQVWALDAPPAPEQRAQFESLLRTAEQFAAERGDAESLLFLGRMLAIHPERLEDVAIQDRCVRTLSSVHGNAEHSAMAALELGYCLYDVRDFGAALTHFRRCDVSQLNVVLARRCLELRACCVACLHDIEAAWPELDAVAQHLEVHPASWEEPLSLQAVYDRKRCSASALSEGTKLRLRALVPEGPEIWHDRSSWFGGL